MASAATFAVGDALPLGTVFVSPAGSLPLVVSITSLVFLSLLGGVSAYVGGAPVARSDGTRHFLGSARDGGDCSNRRTAGSLGMIPGRCQMPHCRSHSDIDRIQAWPATDEIH